MSTHSVSFREDVRENESMNETPDNFITFDAPDEEFPTELCVDGVRVTPSHMIFENAYEGKRFAQKMTIQNCGKRLAFVRLGEPNSKTFEYKSFAQGIHLSPGMRIIRNVNYVYKSALGVKRGFASIFINNTECNYYFIVTLSTSILSLEPQQLDFGRLDAVNHATTRTFYIQNNGTKGTQFAIDLGRNPLELIVEPMRGQVPAKSKVCIHVEILGSQEGPFMEEFWVTTTTTQRVVVTGLFIAPKLLVRKFISSLDFTLIEFQPTYYGSNSTQPLIIKNFSSSRSMFCVMADIKGKTMTLDEAGKIDDNYKNFLIRPLDGRLAALRGGVIQITFAPVKTRNKDKRYAACFVKVIRMDCRDVVSGEVAAIAKAAAKIQMLKASPSSDFGTFSQDNDIASSESVDESRFADNFSFEHAVGVCLHGEKEQAAVVLRPTSFTIDDLTLNKTYNRELSICNVSENLPLKVKYVKVASVEVFPSEFDLHRTQSKEILVTVRASKCGKNVRKIRFDLFAYDRPTDCKVLRKVGAVCLNFRFGVTEVETKPRFQQCVPCLEIPSKLEFEFPYRLNAAELELKMRNDSYYLSYIRSVKRPEPLLDEDRQDYSLTNKKLLALENEKCRNPRGKAKTEQRLAAFIPLAPRRLYNIKVTPKSIRLRKVTNTANLIIHPA